MLNTYEVYNVPVNAMMVVLSSCNTGTGKLVTGEGILSLARGFLFAGSQSVVMSMWAVEDKSSSAVIKSFYKNMRSGQTKSSALRDARLKFLRTADQERSHPYYWSALVIYGDDTPLWFNRIKLYIRTVAVSAGVGHSYCSCLQRSKVLIFRISLDDLHQGFLAQIFLSPGISLVLQPILRAISS